MGFRFAYQYRRLIGCGCRRNEASYSCISHRGWVESTSFKVGHRSGSKLESTKTRLVVHGPSVVIKSSFSDTPSLAGGSRRALMRSQPSGSWQLSAGVDMKLLQTVSMKYACAEIFYIAERHTFLCLCLHS